MIANYLYLFYALRKEIPLMHEERIALYILGFCSNLIIRASPTLLQWNCLCTIILQFYIYIYHITIYLLARINTYFYLSINLHEFQFNYDFFFEKKILISDF